MSLEAQARDLLARVARDGHPAALASSLSVEDMVLADLVGRARLQIGRAHV